MRVACTVLAAGAFAQTPQYGDLELTVLGNGTQPAVNIPVKVVDPDKQDTTFQMTDENSQAYFNDLYIYTTVGVGENQENKKTFEGQVQFLSILGNYLGQKQANTDGSVRWDGTGQTAAPGIYIAKGENGTAMKFFYNQHAVLLGKPVENQMIKKYKKFSTLQIICKEKWIFLS